MKQEAVEEKLKEKGLQPFPLSLDLSKEEQIFRMEVECRFQRNGVYFWPSDNLLSIEYIGNKKTALHLALLLYKLKEPNIEQEAIHVRKVRKQSVFSLQTYAMLLENKVIGLLQERALNIEEIEESAEGELLKQWKKEYPEYFELKKKYPLRTTGIQLYL